LEFVRRLTFSVVMGNGDMHLKNWSLIYPGDGNTPAFAPVYDMLSTVPYIPADGLALSLGGERSFKGLTPDRWKAFANRARLPEPAVIKAVAETVKHIDAQWWTLPERAAVPQPVLERIDAHVKTMIPILTG
ncbi:MAG: HipA domain-containing protein, partial [Novosphingobium sp.]